MRFSERFGHKPVRLEIQRDQIDGPLRAGLWTALTTTVLAFEYYHYGGWGPHYDRVSKRIIVRFFKRPVDETPQDAEEFLRWLRKWFFETDWHQIYDLIEFAATVENEDLEGLRRAESYVELVNQFLEEERSAYRLIGGQISPITSEGEVKEVNAAAQVGGKYRSIATHIKAAIRLYSDRKNPDYRNSIKESISAVEAAVKIITADDKATLGQALNIVQQKHNLHGALKEALSRLYGYTSDEQGIRHAILESVKVEEADARFMLVICSAFTSYLIQLSGGSGE